MAGKKSKTVITEAITSYSRPRASSQAPSSRRPTYDTSRPPESRSSDYPTRRARRASDAAYAGHSSRPQSSVPADPKPPHTWYDPELDRVVHGWLNGVEGLAISREQRELSNIPGAPRRLLSTRHDRPSSRAHSQGDTWRRSEPVSSGARHALWAPRSTRYTDCIVQAPADRLMRRGHEHGLRW